MRKEGLPFPCTECKQTFRSKGDRKRHMRAVHPRPVEGIKVHSFGELEEAIKKRNVDMLPGSRRWPVAGGKPNQPSRLLQKVTPPPAAILGLLMTFLLIASFIGLWYTDQQRTVDDQPRAVTTTVIKAPQK